MPVQNDDSLMEKVIDDLLAQGIPPEEIGSRLDANFPSVISRAGAQMLTVLKGDAAAMLAKYRKSQKGFLKRQQKKWRKPFDLLRMLLEAAMEAGESRNHLHQVTAGEEQDFVFDALRRLHARGCLIAGEIAWLMEGGYASGAMARWRTLHELAVVGYFIQRHGQDVAERFLRHHVAEAYRSAVQYNEHASNLGVNPVPDAEVEQLRVERDILCQRFGDAYKEDWGWAAEALKPRRPNFSEIEKSVSLGHYRPYFKLASHSNHAGSKGIWFDLGNSLNPPDSQIMLAGPSDAGLADPGMCTAISILQLTTSFILHRDSKVITLILAECLNQLTEETQQAFLSAQQELEEMARKRQESRWHGS